MTMWETTSFGGQSRLGRNVSSWND